MFLFYIFTQTIEMSHGKLRHEKNCLNCGHTVDEQFCPNCGQENTENRKPFHYLFTHFVEDFTHYDGQFWGTIKNLLFKPGKLTETYIEGKRQRFVPPVKLYIFISFITFFLFAMFPPYKYYENVPKVETAAGEKIKIEKIAVIDIQHELDQLRAQKKISAEDSVSIAKLSTLLKDSSALKKVQKNADLNTDLGDDFRYAGYLTKKSYDSAQAKNPGFWNFLNAPIAHKIFELKENGVKKKDILQSLTENSFHNLPKALFLYLPIFAFLLWVFHNKKKWWYFEHGVFTLHYFSFLLISILLIYIFSKFIKVTGSQTVDVLLYILISVISVYSLLYFFLAHRHVYKYRGTGSFIIGSVLFTLNFIGFMFLVIILAVISFLMIH